jgi:nitronate monooxygenase
VSTLLHTLGIALPIIQAPMAGISTPAMAAAVSNAGGLGSIGVGAVNAAAAREMISAVRVASDRPFNVNLFCHRPAIANPAREAAWLARLAPELARFGAQAPEQLREIYTSFVADDAMLAMLLEERPRSSASTSACPRRRRSRPCRPGASRCSPPRPASLRRASSPLRGSPPSSRRASRRAVTAACSIPTRSTIAWAPSP